MLILLELGTPQKDIDDLKLKIQEFECTAHVIPGERKLAIGITGPTHLLKEEDFYVMNSVQEVIRVTNKYKLVSRQMKNETTTININNNIIGSEELLIIAGPCAVESREQMVKTAEILCEAGVKFLRAGAFKPRSSPYSFQGLKEYGLDILLEIKEKYQLNIVTEVINTNTLDSVVNVADIIQIGARNMQNFSLLEDAGKTGKPILLKRGFSATIEDLLLSAEYIVSQNNYNLILCERGIRTFETATRNTLDLNAVPVLKSKTHLPVIVDPSHGIGIRDKVSAMALASVACGADGLIIEMHPDPKNAVSDGFQSLAPSEFNNLLKKIKELAPIVDKKLSMAI